jgi:hypothetical protein
MPEFLSMSDRTKMLDVFVNVAASYAALPVGLGGVSS